MHPALMQQMRRFQDKHSESFPGADFTLSGDEYADPAVNEAWKAFEFSEWKRSMELIGPGPSPRTGRGQNRKSAMRQKVECPECHGPLKVWLDIDASLLFNVSATGKLSKRAIEDNTQSDGRCGLKCQECSWQVYGSDVEDDVLLMVIQNADEKWQGLQLSLIHAKP
uniref:Uncharacterized protein n=1 Tax=Pseudomonas fluorescens (strain SBW25) TaxID=216595 RepID=A0A0G4E4D1_PSEFS|nr:hypothetical protein [Pseudomonas fluorescens]CEK42096.1 hypothetical protein PQBR57_0143 [Pseudomonas fluorescens SBW25]